MFVLAVETEYLEVHGTHTLLSNCTSKLDICRAGVPGPQEYVKSCTKRVQKARISIAYFWGFGNHNCFISTVTKLVISTTRFQVVEEPSRKNARNLSPVQGNLDLQSAKTMAFILPQQVHGPSFWVLWRSGNTASVLKRPLVAVGRTCCISTLLVALASWLACDMCF